MLKTAGFHKLQEDSFEPKFWFETVFRSIDFNILELPSLSIYFRAARRAMTAA